MEYSATQFVDDLNHFLENDTGNHKYEHALHKGIESGSSNFCKILLNHAFIKDIDYEWNGLTALMLASQYAYPQLTEILIKMGANIDKVSSGGNIALHWAISCGIDDNVNILINNGADINLYDPIHKSAALIYAVNTENTSVIKLLIDKGANVNAENIYGNTALTLVAIKKNNPENLKILIENGANIYHKNKDDCTALDMAKKYHCTENIKILEEADKKIQGEMKKISESEIKKIPEIESREEDKICCYGKDCLNLKKGICTFEHKEKCAYAENCLNYAKGLCPLQH